MSISCSSAVTPWAFMEWFAQRATSTFGTPPHRIDLLGEIDGVSFLQVWNGAIGAAFEGQQIRVIGLSELKKNKNATGRRKDAEDVRRLSSRKTRKSSAPRRSG
jgi:hypothetical protein